MNVDLKKWEEVIKSDENYELLNIVDGSIFLEIEKYNITDDIIEYFNSITKMINYLEFERLKAANFILEDYLLIKDALNYFSIRLFCIKNFKYIQNELYSPNINKLNENHLFFIYDNINLFFTTLELDINSAFIILLKYGMLNAQTTIAFINHYTNKINTYFHKAAEIKSKIKTNDSNILKLYKQQEEIQAKISITTEKLAFTNDFFNSTAFFNNYEYTLEECGDIFNVTRERVRQLIAKSEKRIFGIIQPHLLGDYTSVFCFSFDKRFLNDYFYVNDLIIHNKLWVQATNIDISVFPASDFFDIFANIYSDLELKYHQINGHSNFNGVWIENNATAINAAFIDNLDNESKTLNELVEEYKKFLYTIDKYHKFEKRLENPRSFGAFVERHGLIYAGKSYRKLKYYNHNLFITFIQNVLKEQENAFSTLKIFRDYPEEMRNFDIRNEIELHSLMKRSLNNDNITFLRTPHISKGSTIEHVLENYLTTSEIGELNDFLAYFEQETGFKAETIKGGYGSILDKHYLKGKVLPTNYDPKNVEFIKSKYNLDLYIESDYINDLDKYGYQTFVQANLHFLHGWMIRDNYTTIEELILSNFKHSNISRLNNISYNALQIHNMSSILTQLRNSIKLFKYDEDNFLYLSDNDILTIKTIQTKIINELKIKKALTINEYYNFVAKFNFNSIKVSNVFLLEIVKAIKSIRITYCVITLVVDDPIILVDSLIKEKEHISIQELITSVQKERLLKLNPIFIQHLKQSKRFFYVEQLDMLFIDKKAYLNYIYVLYH